MNLNALLAIKSDQTQGFREDGKRIPLTVVLASGNVVTQVKSDEKEGYHSIQLGIGSWRKPTKSEEGKSKKMGLKTSPRFFREIRLSEKADLEPGTEINVAEIFEPGDRVDVVGFSKGKGFAGGVKRHGFKGGPRTHGQSDRERAPGSIGQTTTPGRVYKGKRMAGHMGHEQITVKNLEIVEVREDGTILIKGLVPGPVNNLLILKRAGKNKKFIPLYKEPEPEQETVEEVTQPEQVQTSDNVVEEPAQSVETEETQVQTVEDVVETPTQASEAEVSESDTQAEMSKVPEEETLKEEEGK